VSLSDAFAGIRGRMPPRASEVWRNSVCPECAMGFVPVARCPRDFLEPRCWTVTGTFPSTPLTGHLKTSSKMAL
jgi:hypothetical protein